MLENLVVALDGSASAGHAFTLALKLAKRTLSKLSLCSVAESDETRDAARRTVDEAIAKARAAGVTTQGLALEGDPVHEIIAYAHDVNADGIVVGTHGRSGITRAFIGSVAEGVMRRAAIPVITVRENARVPGITNGERFVKILVPVDDSEAALRALDAAVEFAAKTDGDLILCHVVNLAQVALLSGGEAELLPGCLDECESQGKTILHEAAKRAGTRVAVTARGAEGEPVQEIKRLAGEIQPDFIVIGSHGRSGVGRSVLGSVAEGIMRTATSPVIVIPAKPPHAAAKIP